MNEATDLAAERQALVSYFESQLIGPGGGDNERISIKDKPYERYLMGAVFPQGSGNRRMVEEEDNQDLGGAIEEESSISLAYELKPASIGLTFFTRCDFVDIELSGACYVREQHGDEEVWLRKPLASVAAPVAVRLSEREREHKNLFDGKASLKSVWRKSSDGFLITVTLINNCRADGDGKFSVSDVLHQCVIRCLPVNGSIEGYPSPNRYSWDEEEEELALIYQKKKTFAIGHGCAAKWLTDAEGSVPWVETVFIPSYEVPPVTAELAPDHPLSHSPAFSLQYLADSTIAPSEKHTAIQSFIDCYEQWVAGQLRNILVPAGLEAAAKRIEERLHTAIQRMKKGAAYLANDKIAWPCFELANLAMLMQMVHTTSDLAGTIKPVGQRYVKPDYMDQRWSKFRWRPFQLAFQLLVAESVGNNNSADREVVDLIWFPTGGGKTEAYLAVAAFELFFRRRKFGDSGGGTAVIKRYTLRLLTTQQFERAAALVCACESIRKSQEAAFGKEQFTLGLWVGGASTPNKFADAYELTRDLQDAEQPENPFQLQRCPCCGTRIIPLRKEDDLAKYGIRSSATSFEFFCPESSCEFHEHLPISVIDEHLYKQPPSFLIGTIDKFARLAWMDEPKVFFCGGANGERQPPSLIIQDELHLIAGPLGTIAGLYEAAMDVVMNNAGGKPKYIAATATIRRSAEQIERLYARPVSIFPPSGFTAEDSFFSRQEARDSNGVAKPGRLYIGVMGQYHTPVFSLVHTCAALAQAPCDLDLSDEASDGYWTQVIFHNSRRELGKTMTLCRDDIPDRIKVIASAIEQRRRSTEPVEMSANIPSKEIPVVLERLNAGKESGGAVDMLPCTNMFSVGVDVKRLGLIVMNGQPKTTAEYIQASSRVGRDRIPGLVVAFYSGSKARDRSHYESFIPYHQSLYRAVEPTSVTPYAIPAMERALHASMVIVMRYCAGLSGESGAERFNPKDPVIKHHLQTLLDRMLIAEKDDPMVQAQIQEYFSLCSTMWAEAAENSKRGHKKLKYESRKSAQFLSLMAQYQDVAGHKPELPWATLNSMRNVDQECKIHVMGERDGS
tara:strand:+ start:4530 stop:7742 length:3213 start_codon:yes stop_codon:yes gene_type:complete